MLMFTTQKLRAISIAAWQKMHKNRFKDVKRDGSLEKGKWPEDGHDDEGGRVWHTATPGSLENKLFEEYTEMLTAVREMHARRKDPQWPELAEAALLEAGDMLAMSMMILDRCGSLEQLDEQKIPIVVCLCGSTKFKDAFIEANFRETMAGNIVVTVGFFAHVDKTYTLTTAEKTRLDALHKRKIDLADEILVLNVGGYIGDSTRSEIEYAKASGKPIRYHGSTPNDYPLG